MGRRHTRATVRAELAALVRTRLGEGTRTLPRVRELSSMLGCAVATVVAALKDLCAEGAVEAVPHRGIRILREPTTAPSLPPTPGLSRAQRLTTALLRDRISGELGLPQEPLPSLKVLQARYGAGRAVLRASLDTLVNQGVLQRLGRRYHERALARSVLNVHLVAVGDNRAELGQQTHHQLPLLSAVEDECRAHGLAIRVHVLNRRFGRPTLGAAVRAELASALRSGTTAGCIVWNMFMGPALRRELLDVLTGRSLRVAVLDDGGVLDSATVSALPRPWQTFSVSQSSLSGQIAARYLVEHGHTRIAWMDPYPHAAWSLHRLQGVVGTCRALTGLLPEMFCVSSVESPPRRSAQDDALLADMRRLAGSYSFAPTDPSERSGFVDEVSNPVERQMNRHVLRQQLAPLLKEAMSRSSATAWVAPNDAAALECLRFLAKSRRAVPGQVSVMGFDDSQLAARFHLTSYSHNPRGLAAAMVSYVVDPDGTRAAWDNQPVIEVPGFVRERRTVGPAPGTGS